MKAIDSKSSSIKLFELVIKKMKEFKFVGRKTWGNPGGAHEEDVYEINTGSDAIWASSTAWCVANGNEINRNVIITVFPSHNNNSLGQIMEVCFPFEFSRRFNTRLYREDNIVEIRNYGKFTIGHRSLKQEYFFDYLSEEGYSNEILLDEVNKKYVCILKIVGNDVDNTYLAERLILFTKVIDQYKNYWRSNID